MCVARRGGRPDAPTLMWLVSETWQIAVTRGGNARGLSARPVRRGARAHGHAQNIATRRLRGGDTSVSLYRDVSLYR
eukprot:1049258-Prymnesium_polylepis.1